MLNSYKNSSKYPDRYTRNKKWVKILPEKGRPIQVAELIEIQSLVQDNLKQGFDTIFRNGSRIKGLNIVINSSNQNSTTVSISKGQLYIEGTIVEVEETTLTIPNNDRYEIGVVIAERIVTYKEDSTLRDPIKGSLVLGSPGASRLTWNTAIDFYKELEAPLNSFGIGTIDRGVVIQKELNAFNQVRNAVSNFIYERNGNFCVEGLEVIYQRLLQRSTSNISKFEELNTNLTNAKNRQQIELSKSIASQQLINTLTEEQNRLTASSTNPLNEANLVSIQNRLNSAKEQFSSNFISLISANNYLKEVTSNIEKSKNLNTNQQLITVSPGIAYVKGYRVLLSSPVQLQIPQSLSSSIIETASYTYRGIKSFIVKSLQINSDNELLLQSSTQYTSLELTINNIDVNAVLGHKLSAETFDFSLVIRFDTATTAEDIALTFFNIFNTENYNLARYSCTITTSERESQTKRKENLSNYEAVEIIKGYFIASVGERELVLRATDYLLNANKIIVKAESKLYSAVDNSVLSNISSLLISPYTSNFTQTSSTNTYKLGYSPVNNIDKLSAVLDAISVPLVRGFQDGGTDIIPEDSVIDVQRIIQPSSGDVYTKNIHFALSADKRGITWLVPNRPRNPLQRTNYAPASGSTYFIDFTYAETLVEDSDFILDRETSSIQFIGRRTPVPNSRFNVDYSYYLSKAGLITLDKEGNINYLLSADSKNPIAPSAPEDVLPLASFIMSANDIEIQQLDCRRQTVEQLYQLAEQIKINTANTEKIKLDLLTLNNALLNDRNPIAVFTEPVNDFKKINRFLTSADVSPSIKSFMMHNVYTEKRLKYIESESTTVVTTNQFGEKDYAIIPFIEVPFLKQNRATKIITVSNISPSIQQRSRLFINQPLCFFNKGYINVSPCDPITKTGSILTIEGNESPTVTELRNNVQTVLSPLTTSISNSFDKGTPVSISSTNSQSQFLSQIYEDIKVGVEKVLLHAEILPPSLPGLELYIDGELYTNYRLRNGTNSSINIKSAVSTNGFTSKSDGTVDLEVYLNNNIQTGTHTFSIQKEGKAFCRCNIYVYNNLLTHVITTPLNYWKAGVVKTAGTENIPLYKDDSVRQDLWNVGIDPNLSTEVLDDSLPIVKGIKDAFPIKHFTVNQTFTSNNDYLITSVNLKIANAPTGNFDKLIVYLTKAELELPLKEALGRATADFINVTKIDEFNPGTYTNFKMESPVVLKKGEQYSLGLENKVSKFSNSNFEVYSSVVDEQDINTKRIIGKQLYLEGDLFTSTDGGNLYIEDKEDLTFEVNRGEFNINNDYIVDLGSYSESSPINFFAVNTRNIIPLGTEIIYEYKSITQDNTSFVPFKPNTVVCLNFPIPEIKIRARLRTTVSNLSPLLLLNGSSISLYTRPHNSSEVVSNIVEYEEPYFKVYVAFEYIKPVGTNIEVYYSPTRGLYWEGQEWYPLTELPNSEILVNEELQLYQKTYYREVYLDTKSPSDPEGKYYLGEELRKYFRYKIVLSSTNLESPIVRNITSEIE